MHTFTLPSGPEVGIVEMTGVEEDLLTNQRLIKTGEAVNQVLANCIKKTYLVDGNTGEEKFEEQESGHVKPTFARSEGFHEEPSQEPAQDEAEGDFKEAEMRQVEATASTIGIPTLRAKRNVEVKGVGRKFAGVYYVQGVRHEFGESGYPEGVNVIASFPDSGVNVWGQKTLQAQPSALDRVNVRRRYQDEQVAATLLDGIYREVVVPKVPAAAPLADEKLPLGTAVAKFVGGETITAFLVAGPFGPHDEDEAPVALTGPHAKLPQVGTELKVGGTARRFAVLDPALVASRTSFHNDGRLDDWQLRVTNRRIDLYGLAGGQKDAVLYLFTVLDNTRDRLVFSTMAAPGLQAYLGGRKLAAGEPLDLPAGLHGLLVRARPDAFRERRPQPPVDVAKAAAAGAVKAVHWPTAWKVAGPIPEAGGLLKGEELVSIPQAVTIGGKTYGLHDLPLVDGTLDLVPILDLKPGEKPAPGEKVREVVSVSKGLVAYCFAAVECPTSGKLLVNASADWFMAWHIDGKCVYSTLRGGNQRGALMSTAHTFAVEVPVGRHVLAVVVKPGSKGWSLTSTGALAVEDAGRLHEKFPAPGGAGAEAAEHRAAPALVEVEDPARVHDEWLRQIRRHEARLRWIVQARPGTDCARRAQGCLDRLPRPDRQ